MALSKKYGRIDIPKIGEEEPVFILRAQDRLAAVTIEMYRSLAASHGAPVAASLEKELEAFRNWKGKKKLPD
jgi:hypothetical protein